MTDSAITPINWCTSKSALLETMLQLTILWEKLHKIIIRVLNNDCWGEYAINIKLNMCN